jgi:hypothetical protein
MTALVAGVDYSSQAIDVCLIPFDPDHGDPELSDLTFRRAGIPQHTPHLRPVHAAYIMQQLLADEAGASVGWVWIEEAWGPHRNTDRALLPIYGAIMAAAWLPQDRRDVFPIKADEWRKVHGLRKQAGADKKAQSMTRAFELASDLPVNTTHHSAEAFLIAWAGRRLIWKAAAASELDGTGSRQAVTRVHLPAGVARPEGSGAA